MLVALNGVFQILLYSPLAYVYLFVLPRLLGVEGTVVSVGMTDIAKSVLVFLAIPLAAGFVTRFVLVRRRGIEWYDDVFAPKLGPIALLGLLFTIVVMLSMQGDRILSQPMDVVRISVPLVLFFGLMFTVSMAVAIRRRYPYETAATQSFTAASSNFELAIAVAVATFGIASREAFATVVGPLIEVPVLVGLVYVALWARRRLFPPAVPAAASDFAA